MSSLAKWGQAISTCIIGLLWGLYRVTNVKHLKQHWHLARIQQVSAVTISVISTCGLSFYDKSFHFKEMLGLGMEFPWVHPWVLSLSPALGGTSEEKLGKQSFQSYPSTKNKTSHNNEKIGFVSRIRSIPWVGSGGSWGISWSFLGLGLDMYGFSVVWVWQQWHKHMRWWKSKFQGGGTQWEAGTRVCSQLCQNHQRSTEIYF